jgi:ubiquitin-conjugating enzyme E2 Q
VRDYATLCPKEKVININAKTASKRLMSEYKYLQQMDTTKSGFTVEVCNDNLFVWHCKFFGFDSSDGPLATDLAKTKLGFILFELTFPNNYPRSPPFIRVLRPRFQHMTGHVTLGGSVCTEMLTNQGWSPLNTVEATLVSIRANLIEGNARIDMSNRSDYTEREAKEAFQRMVTTHGWQH